jgi:hypothetical protein
VPCEEGFGEVPDALGEGGADGQFDGISWERKRDGCKVDGVSVADIWDVGSRTAVWKYLLRFSGGAAIVQWESSWIGAVRV